MNTKNPTPKLKIILQDEYLSPYEDRILERLSLFNKSLEEINKNEDSLINFSNSYKSMGLHVNKQDFSIQFKEYAPSALRISIFGDFNYWNRDEFICNKDKYGYFTITIPPILIENEISFRIKHNSRYKINIQYSNGQSEDRNPSYSNYLLQNNSYLFDPVLWNPDKPYEFQYKSQVLREKINDFVPLIYEIHIGLSSNQEKISSYREFTENILPYIHSNGYNTIQIMAVMEHAYYASFGYHVTNFFAISSRFGSPDDLKFLIDKAHSYGIVVLIDLVHSHASTNVLDGLNLLDGTDYLYFHSGNKGKHDLWDSRLFDYSNYETKRFLLSNLSYYLTEFQFDGFRFDGITSMLYTHHGIGHSFVNGYNEYYSKDLTDDYAFVYLMLANRLIKEINPFSITIAEDVSGMPGLCRPINEGGIGFDYRLNMSVPDMWIRLLKEVKDEDWEIGGIIHNLTNRRWNEKHVSYSESHDQSIVGDKTISMWLFDKEIYTEMSIFSELSYKINRGMALHKMIRLITFSLGGEGYLNFIGNEFGHPEWLDFPREGNGFSYKYCKRQWELVQNKQLRYYQLLLFDNEMLRLQEKFRFLKGFSHDYIHQYVSLINEKDKVVVFEKGNLLFIFNFHHSNSYEKYFVPTEFACLHHVVLSTDQLVFGGLNRVCLETVYSPLPVSNEEFMKESNRKFYISIYIPSQCAIVLKSDF